MIIKKLELQGFKSFPDRTRVVFHPGITAIVGPNGTGKSNIVDAILWVLGGQRQKGLRGEKTEDIIFNGNAKKSPLGMADVTMALEHQEEEISINHRAFRSGESEYRLNGKAARLKDIQDALWKQAVAEKEYFVIEQGSVGTILTTKPAEKRALLEEAAGTAFYKDKKREAQSKLASSEQNLIRLEDIISEVSRSKNSLQRQAQAAIRYRKLREKVRELTGFNYRRKLAQLEQRHAEAVHLYGDTLAQEKDLASRIKSAEKDLADRRREVWELEKAIKEGQEALYHLESQSNRTEAEKEREARRIELLLEKEKKAAQAAQELEQELFSFESEIAQRGNARLELEQTLQQKQAEMARAADEGRSVRESFSLLEKNIEILKTQQLQRLLELTELRNENLKADKEIELLARQEAKWDDQLVEEKSLLQTGEESLGLTENELESVRRDASERERLVGELRNSLEEKRTAQERLEDRLEEARKAREEDRYRLQALKKMEENLSGPASEEPIPEALGRLADLIEADAADAALIDALWQEEAGLSVVPALDYLRLASERTLQGHFLLVSPQKGWTSPPPALDDPSVLGYLKSRLRPSPKAQDLLGQLREAVIVKDIRSGIELWLRHPALNFVTPQGDLLLSSGLLRVGRREEGIFALEQEVRKLEDRLSRRDAEITPLAAELEKNGQEIGQLQKDIAAATVLLEELGKKTHELEKKKIADEAERERIAGTVALLEKELDLLRRDKQNLALKRETLLQEIGRLTEEERSLVARIEAEERDFAASRGRNVEEEKRSIGLRANSALFEERLGHISAQMKELAERKESTRKKTLSFREEAEQSRKEAAAAREEAASIEVRTRNLDEEKTTRQTELTQKEADLLQNQTEAEALDKRLAELREELERKKEERVRWEVAKAEIDRDMVNLEETCWQDLKKTLHEVKDEKPEIELTDAEIEEQLAEAEENLQRIKTVNLMAEEEYVGHKERYDFLVQQRDDLRQSIDATQEAIRKIDEESQTRFLAALEEVNKSFQEVFTLLFKGGTAEVKLLDESDLQESGVEIIAQPPGKKVQNIALLSGGEKSLTSLAFLFALFRYRPTPFCILDEVDAALDDVNLARFLDLMKEIKKDTQFIVITHNYKTMEVADYIYGTTMAEPNITKLYSVKLKKQQELIQ
ncbi:MAG: chromosome segregation protein SMC [Candidatus Aminicenantales bacterium]